jgi:S-adenosylmethionine:tRNA ribosyltransferase-isomerase
MTIEFTLSGQREAHEPPEVRGTRRDAVRLLVSRRRTGEITHHAFGDLTSVLLPGDLLVVNTSATLGGPGRRRQHRRGQHRRRQYGRGQHGRGQHRRQPWR